MATTIDENGRTLTSHREKDTVVTSISKVGKKSRATDACLVVIYGINLGKRYNLTGKKAVIGRSEDARIQVDQESVSRKHAEVRVKGSKVVLADLESTNGTYVNDQLIDSIELRDGDYVKIGRTIFKYLSGSNIESDYHEEIYRLTTTDGLTRTYNKRFFLETLERELSRCERYQRHLSLCLFDIDYFKRVNDEHGHLAGDDVLRQMAELISGNIRREDILARYGGEEFAIIIPEVAIDGAMDFAEKCRFLIEEARFSFEDTPIAITISAGVASMFGRRTAYNDFIRQADEALYRAKNSGRNRVMAASEDLSA